MVDPAQKYGTEAAAVPQKKTARKGLPAAIGADRYL